MSSKERNGLKLLQGLGEKVSLPFGFYASVRHKGITVAISKYPFKTSTAVFLTVKAGDEPLSLLRATASRLGILNDLKIEGRTLYSDTGETTPYFLVKAEKEGINPTEEFVAPFSELKERMKKYLFKFEGKQADYSLKEPVKTGKNLIDKLSYYATQIPFKALIHLDKHYIYSVEVNSLFARGESPLPVFVGLKKKLSREFYLPHEIEITLPSNAFVDTSTGLQVVAPLTGEKSYEEVLESLEKFASFKKRSGKELNGNFDITF